MPEISVTVPVYNVEKYLKRCLDSILDQTFKLDYEIICVNDGSTDNSGKILEEYAKKYPKIKIINQENQGLSVARNTALKYVTGKYTMFVDSDDFIAKNTLEGLYNYAEKHGADVVIFDFLRGVAGDKNVRRQHFANIVQMYKDNSFNADTALPFVYRYVPVATWTKFYLTDLIKDLKFEPDLNNQDVPHWAAVYTKAKNVHYYPVPYYFYVEQRQDAITQIRHKKIFDVFKAFSLTENILRESGYFEKFKYIHYAHFASNLIGRMRKIDTNLREQFIDTVKNYKMDMDLEKFYKEDFYPFEKDDMRMVQYIKNNNFEDIENVLKQKNIW